ncbi:MAG: SDR family NAD(P)-dependent oxidoreductase, partial [Actinomycetota bacterium]|nr:SDR family NAD(P)-dependent oxidoreductase [Actinomycetota bacterium]
MASHRLDGKVALITGSDSGIGHAAAVEFAREGADVAVHYLDDVNGAHRTREAIEAEGRRAVVLQCDVSEESQVETMFDAAVQAFGTLDILMNNAGVDASGAKVTELATEVWDKAIRTNVYGYFFCCRRFAR